MMQFSGAWPPTQREYKFQVLETEASDVHASEGNETGDYLLDSEGSKRSTASSASSFWVGLTLVNILVSSIAISAVYYTRVPAANDHLRNAILRPVSWWSPILDAVEIPTYTTTLKGTLFAPQELSMARQEPSPENDAAWAQYERVLTHVVSREEILKLGKDPQTVARFDNEYWRLGDNAYMVQLDIMHQIHCLNILRKAAFATYPGYTPILDKRAKDKIYWIHLSHCVDILLQNLQCNANTEVLTLSWVEDRASPWPDFSVNRQCRDFETLVKWQRENAVDPEKFVNMTRPPDALVWPAPWKGDSELGVKLGEHQLQGEFT